MTHEFMIQARHARGLRPEARCELCLWEMQLIPLVGSAMFGA